MADHSTTGQEDGKFPWHSLRLPQTLFPINYNITLHTDLKLFQVKGIVNIRVKCAKATSNIILHLREMKVTKTTVLERKREVQDIPVRVQDINDDEQVIEREETINKHSNLHVTGTMRNESLEMFLIKVQEHLIPQRNYEINIEFEYPLTDKLIGFYRSSYTTTSGTKR